MTYTVVIPSSNKVSTDQRADIIIVYKEYILKLSYIKQKRKQLQTNSNYKALSST